MLHFFLIFLSWSLLAQEIAQEISGKKSKKNSSCSTPDSCVQIMVSCAPKKGNNFVLSSKELQHFFEADEALGPGSIKSVQSLMNPKGMNPLRKKDSSQGSGLKIVTISNESIENYLKKRQNPEFDIPGFKRPTSLAEVFSEFHQMTEAGCNLFVPSHQAQKFQVESQDKTDTPQDLKMCQVELQAIQEQYAKRAEVDDSLRLKIDSLQEDVDNALEFFNGAKTSEN